MYGHFRVLVPIALIMRVIAVCKVQLGLVIEKRLYPLVRVACHTCHPCPRSAGNLAMPTLDGA